MKNIFLTLITIISLAACQTKTPLQNSKTIVCGKITDFEKVASDSLIQMQYHDLATDFNEFNVWINSDGTFYKELDLKSSKEILFTYASRVSFYLEPGDSLFITIDPSYKLIKPDSYRALYRCFQLSGTVGKMNEDVMNYTAFFEDSLAKVGEQYYNKIRTCTPEQYKAYIDSLHTALEHHINVFNKESNTCASFKDWVKNEIKYLSWFHLCRYPWMHPMKNQKDMWIFMDSLPKDYLEFVEFDPSRHQKKLGSKYYVGAIQEYYNVNDLSAYNKIKNSQIPDDLALRSDTIRKILVSKHQGFNKDVLVAQHYLKLLNENLYQAIKDNFDADLIDDIGLRQTVLERFGQVANLHENPNYAQGSYLNELAEENDFLQALMANYPNKVLYLDFWAPWCSPCMDEMPYAKAIKKQMEGKDVVFVYLGNRCDEAAWKATIAEKQIEGEHYLLNETQFAQLSEIFEVQGIPHFAIIDKEGGIAEQKTFRPSSGDRLIKLLDELL